jgi:hypothetical protein
MPDPIMPGGDPTAPVSDAPLSAGVTPSAQSGPTPGSPSSATDQGGSDPAPELPKWLSQVSPEIRGDKRLHGFQSMTDLAKAHLARGELDSRAIVFPTKDSTPEEIRAFADKMGIPMDPAAYEFDAGKLKDIPGVEKLTDAVRLIASKTKLTKSQASGVYEGVIGVLKAEALQKKAELDHAQASFEEGILAEMGGDKKKADAFQALYKAHLVRLNSPELVNVLAASGVLYNPKLAKAFAELEAIYGDDHQTPGAKGVAPKPEPKQSRGTFGSAYSKEWAEKVGG